eukprot:GGOE01005443.1.p1 GENE.GGOE01005443.1~~GGOE01005443.1.p1  ORF type:complete len:557 (-),score=172.94 GGOE01005443.1:244-1779(-)
MKDFLRRHTKGELQMQRIGSTIRTHLRPCYLTPQHDDGNLHFGDFVMLQSGKTQGFLSCDLDDKVGPAKYGVSSTSSSGPLLRNVFQIVRPEGHGERYKDRFFRATGEDHILHYNEKFCLQNAHLSEDYPLMLHATLVGPTSFSRVSKKQEVTLVPSTTEYDACWQVLAADIRKRSTSESMPVRANSIVVVNHCSTNQHLSTDAKPIRNSFGMENEVCCHRWADPRTMHNKNETEEQNLWAFVTAPRGAHFEAMFDASFKDSASQLERVKAKLLQRSGGGGFRGLMRILKTMDRDGNHQLTGQELQEGLKTYGIFLTDKEVASVVRTFDRDGSGTINVNEFLRELRGDLNPRRRALVLQAYRLLDRTGDGKVNLDDMFAIYGQHIDRHPEVVSGAKTPEKVLLEFSSSWDRNGDGTVTEEEFLEYYADLSACIDNDNYFELMVRNAWHISGGEGQCENTTCHRVLVTHFDGRQTVEEVKNDLGIGPNDIPAMRTALASQGIHDIREIKLTG